jgi:hypothetical protein
VPNGVFRATNIGGTGAPVLISFSSHAMLGYVHQAHVSPRSEIKIGSHDIRGGLWRPIGSGDELTGHPAYKLLDCW